jgi:hypothetical protein
LNRRGFSAAFFTAASLAACAGEPAPIERRIATHSLLGCPVTSDGPVIVTALGDFGGTATASIAAKERKELPLRQDFLGVELKIGQRQQGWSGIGYADPPADLDVALWSVDDGCNLTDPMTAVPPNRGGIAMTSFGSGTGLLVAGLQPAGDKNNSGYALAIDLTKGTTLPSVTSLSDGRAFATATPFGDGVLVAGGIDPSDVTDPMGLRAASSAFVFSAGTFDRERIDLGNRARAHHGAVTLTNGETLLVGGTNEGVVLSSLVAIDPKTRNTRVFGLGTLRVARKDPTVVLLANGQVLVGGGTDENGNAVGTLEWFAADGSSCAIPACPDTNPSFPPRPDLALVALPAGGALAAGAAAGATTIDVFWITADGTAEPLDPLPRPRADARARLVSGSDGSPWAWNGRTWLFFDPWETRFLPASPGPSDGPDDDMPAPVAVDPGLFAWLVREPGDVTKMSASLKGFRHGVRGPLSREAGPLLVSGTDHLAPDRPPKTGVVSFEGDGLHLSKPITVAAPRVVLADTVYADFDLSLERDPSASWPDIVVGSVVVGSGSCPWPSAAAGPLSSVARRGAKLELKVGATQATCPGPEGRVGIAFRAPQFGEAIVQKLTISR